MGGGGAYRVASCDQPVLVQRGGVVEFALAEVRFSFLFVFFFFLSRRLTEEGDRLRIVRGVGGISVRGGCTACVRFARGWCVVPWLGI